MLLLKRMLRQELNEMEWLHYILYLHKKNCSPAAPFTVT